MVRDDLYISVPSYFRCPISLDLMKSPVSLCTGVTYDRSSIQRWLDGGNNTCPATMQVLQSKELVPNHTLKRLINQWSDQNNNNATRTRPATHAPSSPVKRVSTETVHLLHTLIHGNTTTTPKTSLNMSLIKQYVTSLVTIAGEGEDNAALISAEGRRLFPSLVTILDKVEDDLCLLEKIVVLCNLLLKNYKENKDDDTPQHRELVHSLIFGNSATWILTCLKKGRLELRVALVNLLNLIATNLRLDINSCSLLQGNEDAYSGLLNLASDTNSTNIIDIGAFDASLTLLTRLSASSKRNRIKMVRAGCIKTLGKLTLQLLEEDHRLISSTTTTVEKVLKLIEMSSRCEEGRDEICKNESCIKALVKSLLKVSTLSTEHAVTVLWVVCCLYGNKRTVEIVSENNGIAKILVVLQSGCSQTVRGMCGDLLRALRCNSKGSSCVTWYNSKTTHIMPF